MKKFTLLLIVLLLTKGFAFSQLMRTQAPLLNVHQKAVSPIQTLAAGDTIFSVPLLNFSVNAASAPSFQITTEDVDGLTPNASTIQENSWGVYFSTDPTDIDPSQGDVDTAYFYAATSWFSAPGIADNWVIFGSAVIPASGANLSWKVKELDGGFMDGYEVLICTTGGTSADFTDPAVYSVPDNDPSLDTVWTNYGILLDSTTYGGDTVWIAFRHTGNDQFIILLDNIVLTESGSIGVVSNDECVGATDISSAFGGAIGTEMVMGPYDNDSATTSVFDPTTGFECYGEPDGGGAAPTLDNTLWFTFTGDGELYFIETGNCAGVTNYIDDGDTQFSLYSGTCGGLTPVACNEDGPNATTTEYPAGFTVSTVAGTVYYLLVDGFNFNGALSTGEFCLKITHQSTITCADPSITAGTEAQNDTNICFMDTIFVSTAGAIAPNVGNFNGLGWVITSADISGSHDPLNEPSFITSYAFQSPPPAVSTRSLINDGTIGVLQPGNTYYWTPVVFGNAVADTTPTIFLQDLLLDTSCVTTGTSIMVNFLLANDPLCAVGTNDECPGATNINTAFGGAIGTEMVVGPYDNDAATTGPQDPIVGFECYGEPDGGGAAPTLDNTLWFTFTGDGEIYFIETGNCAGITNYIDDGDTQFSLYSGTCGNLTPVACNEDGPNATTTEYPAGFTITTAPGTIYYLIVDGFNFNGALSNGEFCLKITKQAPVTCTDPSVTVGAETQNDTNICWLDTLIVSATGAIAPNIGDYFGIGWIISSASITGSADPLNDPSVLGTYTFTSPAPAVSTRTFINDNSFAPVQAGAIYYWTPVVFGNATAAAPPQFFNDLTLDLACTFTGTSIAANMLVANDPLCTVGIAENLPGKRSSLAAYPSPAKDQLKIEFMNNESGKAIINITDNVGRVVQSNSVGATKGFNITTVNVKSFAAGSYMVNVKTNEGSRTVKFIKE